LGVAAISQPEPFSIGAPPPMAPQAFYGILGATANENDEFTESDKSAVLAQLYVLAGNCIGRSVHMYADSSRHGVNENVMVVGPTGDGRKGTGYHNAKQFIVPADSEWATNCIKGGLSSGEGLVHCVRDANEHDLGTTEKRLLVFESEFAGPLKAMARRGNTLSEAVRQAWDGDSLSILTKNSAERATDPHVSMIVHITPADLQRNMENTDLANGFANRFVIVYSRRSKFLPESLSMPQEKFQSLAAGIASAIAFARKVRLIQRDEGAKRLWDARYEELTSSHPGILGSLSARAAAHCLRLSMICAVMDRSHYVRAEHLQAAFSIWNYSVDSIRYVFGDGLGDRVADAILNHLRAHPAGTARSELFNLFGRNESSGRIEAALKMLESLRMARCVSVPASAKGRPTQAWLPVDPRGAR
jgi:uncharacterized protein DUF3987